MKDLGMLGLGGRDLITNQQVISRRDGAGATPRR